MKAAIVDGAKVYISANLSPYMTNKQKIVPEKESEVIDWHYYLEDRIGFAYFQRDLKEVKVQIAALPVEE